jgi:hypothetical protein
MNRLVRICLFGAVAGIALVILGKEHMHASVLSFRSHSHGLILVLLMTIFSTIQLFSNVTVYLYCTIVCFSFVCLVLAIIGITCSIIACISPKYFSFVALRNDTFYEPEKAQPEPFEYATEADVGLFKYRILDVFVYPWPPKPERALFDKMLLDELRRMQQDLNETDAGNSTAPDDAVPFGDNSTNLPPTGLGGNNTDIPGLGGNNTDFPQDFPTGSPTVDDCLKVIKPGPGSVACGVSASPTATASSSPTPVNPNDIVEATTDIGVVKTYPNGIGQFDSTFTRAQKGAILGPVFAFIGTVFSLMELLFCIYKCSWLPAALFLYLAFMFQLFTLFLFLSEDWWYVLRLLPLRFGNESILLLASHTSILSLCFPF